MTAKRLARVALQAERDSKTTMRRLAADLERELRVLRSRESLDATGRAQLARILAKQSAAWNELTRNIDRDREAARKAANLAANETDKEFLALLPLSPAKRRELSSGPPSTRAENATVAKRVSDSNRVARDLLTKRFNQAKDPKRLARTLKGQAAVRERGGISYVAERLVRTETALAYQNAQIERAEATPWVKGLRWTLSATHSGKDICDKLSGRTFAPRRKSVPLIPHPNCLCTLTPILMSKQEFRAALKQGVFNHLLGIEREIRTTKARPKTLPKAS